MDPLSMTFTVRERQRVLMDEAADNRTGSLHRTTPARRKRASGLPHIAAPVAVLLGRRTPAGPAGPRPVHRPVTGDAAR